MVLSLSFEALQLENVMLHNCGLDFATNFNAYLSTSLAEFCKDYGLNFPISPSQDSITLFEQVILLVKALGTPVSIIYNFINTSMKNIKYM